MRKKVLKLRQQGFSFRKIASILNISKAAAVYNSNPTAWLKQQKEFKHRKRNDLIKEAGGKCSKCGYNKCIAALDFHHIDSKNKSFGISQGMRMGLPYKKLLKETKKCILVCSNCHHEMHENLRQCSSV